VSWKVVRGRKSGTPLQKAYTKGSDDAIENAKDQAAGTDENKNKQNNITYKFGAHPGAAGGDRREEENMRAAVDVRREVTTNMRAA
jgi:hypothetical protein